jgi:hypothetical protein
MTDIQDTTREIRDLEERLRSDGLTPAEEARLDELRAATPATSPGTDPSSEEPTGVLWERGPVEQPADPLPEPLTDLVSGSPAELAGWEAPPAPAPLPQAPIPEEAFPRPSSQPPLPPADPAFAAVAVEGVDEAVPEISADEVEEIVEFGEAAPAVVAVSVIEEDTGDGEAVSLDALAVTPPPPNAASLAPPLPPPAAPPPMPHPAPAPARVERDPFAASPSFVSGEHRIVLHTVDGQVMRGAIANADLEDPDLPLIQPNGAVARVPASQVKAVFFMLETSDRPTSASGTRVRVTFGDGRQVSGLSPDYSESTPGFFVLPADARTNTARVWVYRAAVRQITVG